MKSLNQYTTGGVPDVVIEERYGAAIEVLRRQNEKLTNAEIRRAVRRMIGEVKK